MSEEMHAHLATIQEAAPNHLYPAPNAEER